MSRAALQATRKTVYRWIALQILAVIVISLLFFLWQGSAFASSVLIGGMVCILPNGLFVLCWFARFRVNAVRRLVMVFYFGELLKLFLMGFLFVLAQKLLSMNVLGALMGFITAQVAFLLAPLLKKREKKCSM
ncbi:MAG TPA: ATP synthase subunit I [Gammaproteobacteria bacterium]|nr:ATP synthase subunit I [Gammaproteobacteria bacterium]